MSSNHSLRHLHLGCGEALHSRLPAGLSQPMPRRSRRALKRDPRPR